MPKMYKRPCPICGKNYRVSLQIRTFDLPASPTDVYWEMHDVVCVFCAFVYSAKVFFDAYYKDYYNRTDLEVKVEYKSKRRSALVRQYTHDGKKVLEFGPGESGFRDFLGDDYEVSEVEIGEKLPQTKHDITAAYFVLEHVPDPRSFIYAMRAVTKASGHVIIEVPDFRRYPKESLFPEHINHFTEFHLRTLLETCGLNVVECIHGHSRKFGIVMVASLKPDHVDEMSQIYKGNVE